MMSIPVLDLQTLDLDRLDSACCEWGFFALRGHGVDPQVISAALEQTRRFFNTPIAEKNRIRRSASNPWGFYDAELTKNRRDWKEILDIGPAISTEQMAQAQTQWPALSDFEADLTTLQEGMHTVALALVEALGRALERSLGRAADLSPDLSPDPPPEHKTGNLLQAFHNHTSFLRLNFYPTCPDPAPADADFVPQEGQLGISHHTDAGAVTVLLQDAQPGLQVLRDNRWYLVDPVTDAFIINIGDIVQVWSNDRYQAPLHRVLANSDQERFSIPYFLNPAYDYDYAPLLDTAPRYKPINWGQFREGRAAGDYADYGNEIQISDFRLS